MATVGDIRARLLAAPGPWVAVLCGPSHAGKSTFAAGLAGRAQVINPDALREQETGTRVPGAREAYIWQLVTALQRVSFGAGKNVVIDACHVSELARRKALAGAGREYTKWCVVFDVPLETVRERCVAASRVPLPYVEQLWADFAAKKPTPEQLGEEGFTEWAFVDGGW